VTNLAKHFRGQRCRQHLSRNSAWYMSVSARSCCVQKSRFLHKTQTPETRPLSPCRLYVQNGGMIYGYARVSTDGQSVDAQVAALTAAGAGKVFREVASG